MMAKFKTIDLLFVSSGRGRKPAFVDNEYDLTLKLEEETMESTYDTGSSRALARHTDLPCSKEYKIVLELPQTREPQVYKPIQN